jgi:tRNA-dihydrouridine synthase B
MENFWEKLPKPILALAPMAGVTDSAFRQMCKLGGADVLYTEFVSTDAIVYESKKTFAMLKFQPGEQPVVCQIFGKNPEHYYKAVKVLAELGFAGIDINFGCPATKVVKHGGGVTLMRNLPLVWELVQAACEGSSVPISVKIRASIRKDGCKTDEPKNQVSALDLVEKIKGLPVAAVMIHGRSFEQFFDGVPNTEVITKVKQVFPGIVLANGGVYSPEAAKELLDQTGADGVGIARGAWGRPWFFQQVREYLNTGKYHELSWDEKKVKILEHAKIAFETGGSHGLVELRKHLAWYVKGLPNAAALRSQLVRVSTLEDVETALENL